MLADFQGKLTKALGVELDLDSMLGGVRCKRYVRATFGSCLHLGFTGAQRDVACSLALACSSA